MDAWLARVPDIDVALVVAVAVAALFSLVWSRRGGRHRELPGWSGFWVIFAAVLASLAHLPRWASFPMLGLLMFAALRTYFFVAPVRPRDRYAVLAAYLAIPFALWPAYVGSIDLFLATIPVALFLFIPVFLSIGSAEQGLLDSIGRTLIGVTLFVFCLAHLGLLVHMAPVGLPELFGVLVLAAELPQRLAGRFKTDRQGWRLGVGIPVSLGLTVALGWWLGPWVGMVEEDAARAGFLVFLAVTMGATVNRAVSHDLALTSPSARMGRGALLNRVGPALYAAPVFFHYLNTFA